MDRKQYLLTCLMEEHMEAAQAISKILRFTEHDISPVTGIDNMTQLNTERDDIIAIEGMLSEMGFELKSDQDRVIGKIDRLEKWIAYSQEKGTVENDKS